MNEKCNFKKSMENIESINSNFKCNDIQNYNAAATTAAVVVNHEYSDFQYNSIACDETVIASVEEINGIFEDRIIEIDEKASGDYKLKYDIYKEWVDMLIGVIRHMIESLSELELCAKTNIISMENQLNKCRIFDHVEDINSENLKNDLMNLLTLIQRAIQCGKWDTRGLNFKTITEEQIFGKNCKVELEVNIRKLNSQFIDNGHQIDRLSCRNSVLKTELDAKELFISNLETKLRKLQNDIKCKCLLAAHESNADGCSSKNNDSYTEKLKKCITEKEQLLAKQLEKNETLTTELEVLRSKCDRKEKVIDSMKSLAFEVADKHDQIQQHKSQLSAMEEELQQALKKIQFKDSVIKDLRRDLKTHLTKPFSCCNIDLPSTDRSYCTALNSPSASKSSDANNCICLTEDQDQESIAIECENQDMNRRIEFEQSKLIVCQAEEEMNYKMLGLELDELTQLTQRAGNENMPVFVMVKELTRIVPLLETKIQDIANENTLNKKKLNYVRNQLTKITHGKYEFKNFVSNNNDCGYISQEETDIENKLLTKISGKIMSLEDELCCVQNQVGELQMEIESAHSNVSSKTQILEKSSRVLKDLLQYLSKINGTTISSDIDDNYNDNELKDVSVYKNLLDTIISHKDEIIDNLNECNRQTKEDLNYREAVLSNTRKELQQKMETIESLRQNLDFTSDSIKVLEHEKKCIYDEYQKLSNLTTNSDLKRLLNENEELQTLNKNQVKTISNLMEALESMKMEKSGIVSNHSGNNGNESEVTNESESSTTVNESNQNRSGGGGSLWSWWRGNNTYDI